MNFFAISALVNVMTSSILGTLVLLADTRSKLHRTFFFFAAAVTLWSISYFWWQLATDAPSALFWVHMLMAGSIFIPVFYFHFTTHFLNRSKEMRHVIIIGYIQAAIFSVINWTPLFVIGVTPKLGFPFWPDAGPIFLPFLLVWGFYAMYPVYLLLVRLRVAENTERSRIRLILLGTAIGYIGGETNHFLWYNIPVLPYGTITASIYLAFVAVSIMRYRFLNMKMIATELLTFALWFFIFMRMIFSTTAQDQLLEAALLGVTLVIGVLLIRSVDKEVEQREEIQELSNQKSEFMSFASHEIRNPITAMRGYASLIVDGTAGQAPESVKNVARKVLVEGNDVLELISQFLNKSKLELGQLSYAHDTYDLGAVVAQVVDGHVPHAQERGLSIKKRIDLSQHLAVIGDEGKTKEVVGNLIDNALKYTKRGGITVSVEKIGKNIRAEVVDTGVGIPAHTIEHLFKKFSRADAQKMNLLGTGLGLYLGKTFIEAQGGKIWAESDGEGRGSRFIIEFPAA